MRYVAAYLLATLGGNASPSENDLKKILESVGVGYDANRASTVVKQLKGKSLPDVSSWHMSIPLVFVKQYLVI